MQPDQAARKPKLTQRREQKSPSPGRHLPGNMRISFRRSPTPIREVVPYRPDDAAAETRSLQRQLAEVPAPPLQHQAPPSPAVDAQAIDASGARSRQVQVRQDPGKKKWLPWKLHLKVLEEAAKGKGRGKSKGKKGKGKKR